MLSLTHCTIHQPPFWTWNEARGALKLPRCRMISVASPSIIMKNGTIVGSYFNFPRDNYEQKQTRTPSLEYVIYVEYIVHSCRASFQIKNGGWVIRVYYSVSLALCNMGYGVSILPALRWTVSKQKHRMKDFNFFGGGGGVSITLYLKWDNFTALSLHVYCTCSTCGTCNIIIFFYFNQSYYCFVALPKQQRKMWTFNVLTTMRA